LACRFECRQYDIMSEKVRANTIVCHSLAYLQCFLQLTTTPTCIYKIVV
jgi:hypothetical protein